MSFDTEAMPPILTVRVLSDIAWDHRPGGCRCACGVLHGDSQTAMCMNNAEPGRLLRVESPSGPFGPLPICLGCYISLAPGL
ncbi:DUF6372 family protein [Streptomyces sp. NPDC059477]|uniref:DUF6372 family protein n=1 Tax=Streptomyces sp. NPDC059477 TaxID=3346847 RepID=UPI00368900E8